MLRERSVESVEEFFVPEDSDGFRQFVADAVEQGVSRTDWCFVVDDGPLLLARVGFTLEPSTSDPSWLGTLPSSELHSFGLHWTGQPESLERLLRFALRRLGGLGPAHTEVRVNRRTTPNHGEAVAVLQSIGGILFQEKAGFEFEAPASGSTLPDRIAWSTVEDVGAATSASIMARCGAGTLDRNDEYYWSRCGPENWGNQMMEYLDPDDADMWLVGHVHGEPVGYVFVTTDPVLVSTIGHIGVVPEARGHGYIDDLLDAAAAGIAGRGVASMLSDVDVLNLPMLDAMRRAGHRDSDWHVWHYRCPVT